MLHEDVTGPGKLQEQLRRRGPDARAAVYVSAASAEDFSNTHRGLLVELGKVG